MNIQRYTYIALIFLVLLSLSAVSAADDSASDIISATDNNKLILEEPIDDDVSLSAENDELILEENNEYENGLTEETDTYAKETYTDAPSANPGTYSGLTEEIAAGGNIELQHDYYRYDSGDSITISENDIVIDGKGAIIDMAGSCKQVLVVRASGVTIKNLSIKNAYFDKMSGTIIFHGAGTVTNCTFINNTSEYYGGGIHFFQSGTVTNCTFINNTGKYGGAISFHVEGSATNCNFENNKAYTSTGENTWGGAIYFQTSGDVRNCNFTNNTASYDGAVYFNKNGTVTNCNFINNTAINGGAVGSYDNCTIENCNFINNTAVNVGAVNCMGPKSTVTNCNFTNNIATSEYTPSSTAGGGAVNIMKNGTVTNCIFINNSANKIKGGAIYFRGNGTVTNCSFTGNTAAAGSAIYFYNSTSNIISNSSFLNNRANAEALEINKDENGITITFTGQNNLLNAIYYKDDAVVNLSNVTYWGANGIENTEDSPIAPSKSNMEAGQNISVGIIVNDVLIFNEVKVTDTEGKIVLDMDLGENYFIIARHDADSYYTEAEKIIQNMNFIVNVTSQTTTNKTVNITAKSNIYGEYSEVMPGKLLFILPNSDEISANYAGNGTWWALYTFNERGNYNVTASYSGLDNVIIKNATITINKIKTGLTASAITTTYNINKNLVITLKDSNGKALKGVKVKVSLANNKEYTTDKNGQIKIAVGKLIPKTYTAKITFAGNADYIKSTKSVKVTVKKATPKMIAKNKTFKVKVKTKKYTITLKNNKGQVMKSTKVTLKVNKKTFTAKTNKKGVATFKITNLKKKGKFTAVIKYAGSKYYNKLTKKARITVKK